AKSKKLHTAELLLPHNPTLLEVPVLRHKPMAFPSAPTAFRISACNRVKWAGIRVLPCLPIR
ncbi:hypothetical protein, partial [Methylacidimicrobium cyclopophantes]|uniref:hypothetical protein n=1 Tax=Methylacidimicrobium cyclopophantes TaxID=1041766 RepID=UPI001C49C1C0